MTAALAASLPYAVALVLSGVPILMLALVLVTKRPPVISAMFLLGWAAGIVAVSGLIVALVSSSLSIRPLSPTTVGIVRLALGALVAFLALRSWRARAATEDVPPRWVASVRRWSPARTFTIGFALGSVNPKTLALAASGATAILSATTTASTRAIAILVFALVASLGIALPIVLHAIGGDTIRGALHRTRTWMEERGKTLSTIVLAIIAVVLIVTGVSALR